MEHLGLSAYNFPLMSDVNSPQFWQQSYQDGRFPWDLGGPTPVFQRLLEHKRFPPGRMIVLGAGRGHDARLFARYGFDVTAVDFAGAAVRAMQELSDPKAPIDIVEADIFALPLEFNSAFDYVLEYTCFCAIDPRRRVDYADEVARLLKPAGIYIALAFPIGKRPGGPPFVVSPDKLIALFAERHFTLQHREFPPDSIAPRRGVEELLILRKEKRESS